MRHWDSIIPSFPVREVVRGMAAQNPPPQLLIPTAGIDLYGAMPLRDLVPTLLLATAVEHSCVLEFGTYFGTTTLALALNLPGSLIHTIDLPVEHGAFVNSVSALQAAGRRLDDEHLIARRVVGEAFKGHSAALRIVQHYGDTATLDYAQIPPATFFVIDASHTYEYVKNDTERALEVWARAEERQATLVWHDCDDTHPGVLQYLCQLRQRFPLVHVTGTEIATMTLSR